MTGFNHGLTGAIIALTIKQPALALPLSFLSHFVQDMIPHFGFKDTKLFSKVFNRVLLADFILALGLMGLLAFWFPSQKWLIWSCMILAASPDLAWAYYRLYVEHIKHKKPKYDFISKRHLALQWSQTLRGAWVELAWFMSAIAIIFYLR